MQARRDWGHHRVSEYRVRVCARGATSLNGRACNRWVDVDAGARFAGPPQLPGGSRTGPAGWEATADDVIEALFSAYVETRFVRIYPTAWTTVCLRAGVLILQSPPKPPAPPAAPPSPAFPLLALQQGAVSLPLSAAGELLALVQVRLIALDCAWLLLVALECSRLLSIALDCS